jgi:hypothetical protein
MDFTRRQAVLCLALALLGAVGQVLGVAPDEVTITSSDTPHTYAVVADAQAAPSTRGVVMVGGSDGSNIRLIATDSSGRAKIDVFDGSGNAITSTSGAMDLNLKTSSITLPVNITSQSLAAVAISRTNTANAANNVIFIQESDGTSALTNTSGARDINIKSQSITVNVSSSTHDGSGNPITSTSSALDINIKSLTNAALPVSATSAANSVSNPLFFKPTDGTNAAAVAAGSAAPTGLVLVGGTDGTNGRQMSVSTSGHPKADTFDGSGNAITSTANPTGVRGLDVTVQTFVSNAANQIFQSGTLTSSATTANQTVVTYTVPAGFSFSLVAWSLYNTSGNNVTISPGRLRVAGSDIVAFASIGSFPHWAPPALGAPGVHIAASSQVITLTVTPSAATSTNWSGFITGYLIAN